jgi:5-carboxymethyl-2-hydroxymuconate isomerase
MPHFTIEYSANLETRIDIDGLIAAVHHAAIDTGIFPLKGTRTRACARSACLIADGHPENGFVDIVGRIGGGRDEAVKQAAAESVFDAACEFLRPYFDQHPLAVSLEFQEIDPRTSFKFNNLPEWIERRRRETTL